MASGIYNRFKANLMSKAVDLDDGDTINVALYDTNHSFTATDSVYTTDNELATAGEYTQGGKPLTYVGGGTGVTEGVTTKWDADDVAWSDATFTAHHAVLYSATASNNLICSFDFGGGKEVSSGTFTIEWDDDGIITLATA